jgi:hypothetical protein
VIGPSDSGKSLILNSIFGTEFLSANGRCTRGVYGSLIDVNFENAPKYKKILILDSEGTQTADTK